MISRRAFSRFAGVGALACQRMAWAQPTRAEARRPIEWSFVSSKSYTDPFSEVELDAIITDPEGVEHRIPGFWAGEDRFRLRYAPNVPGRYTYKTVCSDPLNGGLHARAGSFEVVPYEGSNPVYSRGQVRVAADKRHFEHADGTPFFWLGDTNWMGLCYRLGWPDEFQWLAADRAAKGFTVVQIVAGLYPDMPPFDRRGANEAGFPWENGYSRINPAYFDAADLRIRCLVESGLVPCIVGCWGYFLPMMGLAKIKQHWRYLVARWGAYPVIWCLCGEVPMPYYHSKTREADRSKQIEGWNEVGRYIRRIDSYHHLITVHPSIDWLRLGDPDVIGVTLEPTLLDFLMLEISAEHAVKWLRQSLVFSPRMPALVGEMEYEGMLDTHGAEEQRRLMWACMLSGAAGHTYGANGLWQLNRAGLPFGLSAAASAPDGQSWGDIPWDSAAKFAGSRQVGLAKSLLSRYPWWRLEPHPDWVELAGSHGMSESAYAAAISSDLYFIYIPAASSSGTRARISHLDVEKQYRGFFFNPIDGTSIAIGALAPEAGGQWTAPMTPARQDWVLVLERVV